MTDIDSLQIKINAEATRANNAIDNLIAKLDKLTTSLSRVEGSKLTGLANGVQRLGTAMQTMNTIKTADFTRLANNLTKLGSVNVSSLNSTSSSMSQLARAFNSLGTVSANAQAVGDMAKNIAKLGNKSVQTAITNIPQLATAMNNLMTTLSRSPQVSQNVIQMTNALANLASQGSKVGSSSNALINGLNRSATAMNKATKSSKSLAAAFGKFYATWFLIIRGVKKLWSSIEGSMDYIEVLNYFDAAFTQVAEKADLSSWRELGYSSAEEYANSFAERAKELTSKMTGFEISPIGTLEATGMPSLGLDPSQLMNYQAMFGQMASSMGVASETAVKLSDALSMIGADLASVKNLDFEDVWEDMASGIAGMSRTLDKYGVNIRNVNLQQRLTELGIDANITALNQNDKALLRAIILLDSTRYAWGDLADTINQPANQLRLITANFQNLSRTIGNLFLPLVQKVLPYINALVIALQRLFTWIGNLLGIDLSKVTSSIGNTDFSDLIDDTDDLTNGLNEAAKAADKLKKGIRSFDELNVITTQDDSGTGEVTGAGLTSGLLDAAFEDALSEYQKAWDEAFANMENRAQELADKVEKSLQPIKDIIEDFAVGDFFKAGQDVSNLVVSITDFFARAIDNVDWYGIGQKIGDFLAGLDWIAILKSVGNLIWQALKASIELWKGSFDAAPIETGIITAIALLKWTGIGSIIIKGIKKAIVSKLGEIISIFTEGGFFTNLGLVIENLFSGLTLHESMIAVFGELGTKIAGIGTIISGVILAAANFVTMLKEGFNWLNEILMVVGIALAAVGAVILGVPAAIAAGVAAVVAAVATVVVVVKDNWDAIAGFFVGLWDSIVSIWNTVASWFDKNVIEPIVNFFVGLATRVQQIFEGLWIIIQAVWVIVSDWFNEKVITPIVNFFSPIVETLSDFFSEAWENIKSIWSVVSDWFKDNIIAPVLNVFKTACDAIGGFFASLWSGIKKGVASAMNTVIVAIEGAINWLVSGINDIIGGFNRVVSWAASIIEVDWGGVDLLPKVSLGRINISGYATGGFPEDGLFYANHNELVGRFSSGKTAVANNDQIISGIRQAAYEGMKQALSETNNTRTNVTFQVEGDPNGIFKVTQREAMRYTTRTGRPAYN